MDNEQSKFEGFAIIEIMGHQKEIGYVTTAYFGGPALFRVDQPELPEREVTLQRPQYIGAAYCPPGTVVKREALPAKTSFVGPSAVFRLTPCTEETARRAIEHMIPVPLTVLSIPEKALITAGHDDDDMDSDPDSGFEDKEF